MSWLAPKTASPSSVSATTTPGRTTTFTSRNFQIPFMPAGRDLSPMMPTSLRPRDRAKCRRSILLHLPPLPRPHLNLPLDPHTSVEADFAVELGADDETLELPWAAADGGLRYYDLKRQP